MVNSSLSLNIKTLNLSSFMIIAACPSKIKRESLIFVHLFDVQFVIPREAGQKSRGRIRKIFDDIIRKLDLFFVDPKNPRPLDLDTQGFLDR